MAELKTDIVTLIDSRNPAIADKNEYMGTVHWVPVEYSTDISGGNTLSASKPMPVGAELIMLDIAFTALAGSATADFGYAGTATSDVILDGVDVATATVVHYPSITPGTNGATGGPVDVGGKVLTITLAGETLDGDTIGGLALIVLND